MRVLIFCATYPPATRGGTLRAIEGLVAHLGQEFDFAVFTRARDGAVAGRWVQEGRVAVFRAAARDLAPDRVIAAAKEAHPDAYYVNSFFSPTFGIQPTMLRWRHGLPEKPMIIAPRGELSPGALRFKRLKKLAYLRVAKECAAYRDVLWQAGNSEEAAFIARWFPSASIAIARDLAKLNPLATNPRPPAKVAGDLRIVFLSRITPVKNLTGALRLVGCLEGRVSFDFYGPVVEKRYLRECLDLAGSLPSNVRVRWGGEVPHASVLETLAGYHVFLLPSFGESFGHAILEALVAGVPPVISDQTPWRGLEAAGVGWECPILDEEQFVRVLRSCAAMDHEQWLAVSARARAYGAAAATSRDVVEDNRRLFIRAAGVERGQGR